jgi:hypothetical protein
MEEYTYVSGSTIGFRMLLTVFCNLRHDLAEHVFSILELTLIVRMVITCYR